MRNMTPTEPSPGYALIEKIDQIRQLPTILYLNGRFDHPTLSIGSEIGEHIARKLRDLDQRIFLVSGDGRTTTPTLHQGLISRLSKNGIQIIDAGVGNTTPMFETERRRMRISGANITASHLPWHCNGLTVVFDPTAHAAPSIEGMNRSCRGIYDAHDGLMKRYLNSLEEAIRTRTPRNLRSHPIKKILFDGMQGVGYGPFLEMARRFDIGHDTIRTHPDGFFPLTICGPNPGDPANYNLLSCWRDLSDYAGVLQVDGDADRFAAGYGKMLIPPPIFIAMHAEYLANVIGPGPFVTEHCVATIIEDYLRTDNIPVIRSDRGKTNVIPLVQTTHAIGGGEYALHNYGPDGIDDAVLNCFEYITMLRMLGDTMDTYLQLIASQIRPYIPEQRSEYHISRQRLVDQVAREAERSFSPLSDLDGITYETEDLFWNIRPSSNDRTCVINVNGRDRERVSSAYRELVGIMRQVDPGYEGKKIA
jgi:phosphomannomutase